METIEGTLTAAAVALLQQAPPAMVRRVLRELLSYEDTSALPVNAGNGAAERNHSSGAKPSAKDGSVIDAPRALAKRPARAKSDSKVRRKQRSNLPVDPAWEQLRSELRAAMTERDATYAAVAAAIGMSELTVRLGICRTQSPGASMMNKLRTWLAAPAVAADAVAFSKRANGVAAAARGAAAGA
jgi:hypothetical protein